MHCDATRTRCASFSKSSQLKNEIPRRVNFIDFKRGQGIDWVNIFSFYFLRCCCSKKKNKVFSFPVSAGWYFYLILIFHFANQSTSNSVSRHRGCDTNVTSSLFSNSVRSMCDRIERINFSQRKSDASGLRIYINIYNIYIW